MNEEKFISIDYDTWNNKYKPMEEKLEKVEDELKKEKENKTLRLVLREDWKSFPLFNRPIATIELMIEGGYNIKNLDTDQICKYIFNKVNESNFYRPKIVTSQELKEALIKVENKRRETEQKVCEYDMRVDKIPKFVRWLFNIKFI